MTFIIDKPIHQVYDFFLSYKRLTLDSDVDSVRLSETWQLSISPKSSPVSGTLLFVHLIDLIDFLGHLNSLCPAIIVSLNYLQK